MLKLKTNLILIFIITFLFSSCKDEITNQYLLETEGGSAPDVNVIFSNYSLNTVHSYHMDTTAYPQYNYSIDLNLKLDKPDNRSQINKLIVVNEVGFGWEYFGDELESFYSDTLGGYALKNLVYYSDGQYPPPQTTSTYYRVKLFSKTNKASEDYELFLIPNFISAGSISHNWYTQSTYQLNFNYSSNFISGDGEVFWLNSQKQIISTTNFTYNDFVSGYYLRLNNVPQEAYYFYFTYQCTRNNVKVSLKSALMQIEGRFPDNIQILNEYIYDFDIVKYVPEIQKILIVDDSYNYLNIIDYSTFDLTSKITFASSPISVVYSNYDNKIYVGCKNGKLYSVEVTGTTPSFVRNLGGDYIYGLIAIDKYIAASCSNGYLRILNLETNTLVSENSFYYNTSRDMIFNKTNNVLYGSNGSYLFRVGFNPVTGLLSNPKSIYFGGSSGYTTLLLYPDDTKIVTGSGYIYNCSSNQLNDLSSSYNLGQSFNSCAFSSDSIGIITFYPGYSYSYNQALTVFHKNSYSTLGYLEEFWGSPLYLIANGDEIKVLSKYSAGYSSGIAAEILNYSDLISVQKKSSKIVKDKYYLPHKLIF